jgi:hypothetical protein
MSDLAYILPMMGERDKPIVWLHGEIKTPPMSVQARLEAGHSGAALPTMTKLAKEL